MQVLFVGGLLCIAKHPKMYYNTLKYLSKGVLYEAIRSRVL